MKTVVIEDKPEMEAIISQCEICHVGVIDEKGRPYVIPMNFGYQNNTIYFHSAPQGHIIDILNANNKVCVTFTGKHELVYQHPEVACSYRMKAKSVIVRGHIEFVNEFDEKVKVLNIIMNHYSAREFKYSDPAVRNVKIWKVEIDNISAKEYGAPHK